MIHNHPQGYEKFGGTLTPSDIRQMARGEWAELSSVSKDPGCGNYTVRQLQGANTKALKKSLRANRDAIEDAYVLAYEAARRKALSTGQTKEQANIIANKKGSNGYHQWWKKFLPKYGYEYTAWK